MSHALAPAASPPYGGGEKIGKKRLDQIDEVDRMSPPIRACVHDFGYPIVKTFLKFGCQNPTMIREVVREILFGVRDGGQKTSAYDALEFVLSRGPVNVHQLLCILEENGLALVPANPTRAMLEASEAEVSGGTVRITKRDKHRLRLTAALRAGMAERLRSWKPSKAAA
jgi:hypothetical protein